MKPISTIEFLAWAQHSYMNDALFHRIVKESRFRNLDTEQMLWIALKAFMEKSSAQTDQLIQITKTHGIH